MIYSVLVINIIIPHYRDGETLRQLYRFRDLLPPELKANPEYTMTMGDLVKACLLRPMQVINATLDQTRITSLLLIIVPFGIWIIRSGWVALWILPPLAPALLSSFKTQHALHLHYGIAIIPPAAIAAIWGIARITGALRKTDDEQTAIAKPIAGYAIAILMMAVLSQYYLGHFPGCEKDPSDEFEITQHVKIADEYFKAIPADAKLSATVKAGPQVARRHSIYVFPELQDADHILIDTRGPAWPMPDQNQFRLKVESLLKNPNWGATKPYNDGWLLLKKDHATDLNQQALESLNFKSAYK